MTTSAPANQNKPTFVAPRIVIGKAPQEKTGTAQANKPESTTPIANTTASTATSATTSAMTTVANGATPTPIAKPTPAPMPTPVVVAAATPIPSTPTTMATSAPASNVFLPVARKINDAKQEKYEIQMVEFKLGVSSITVERMAKNVGCTGGKGAGLMSSNGSTELYRMNCENGSTIMARCELRQCQILDKKENEVSAP